MCIFQRSLRALYLTTVLFFMASLSIEAVDHSDTDNVKAQSHIYLFDKVSNNLQHIF